MTAHSVACCSLVVVVVWGICFEKMDGEPRAVDFVCRITSRSPISFEANRDVPPPSLAQQRKIVLSWHFAQPRFIVNVTSRISSDGEVSQM